MSVTPYSHTLPIEKPVGMYDYQVYKPGDDIKLAFQFDTLLTLYGLRCFVRNGGELWAAYPTDYTGFKIWPSDTVESLLAAIKVYEARHR